VFSGAEFDESGGTALWGRLEALAGFRSGIRDEIPTGLGGKAATLDTGSGLVDITVFGYLDP